MFVRSANTPPKIYEKLVIYFSNFIVIALYATFSWAQCENYYL